MQDLIGELTNELARKISKNYDDLAFSMLGQFGINKDNYFDNLFRVWIVETGLTKHFFIDDEYRFSIMERPGELIIDEAKDVYKYVSEYKVEIFEDMRCKKL